MKCYKDNHNEHIYPMKIMNHLHNCVISALHGCIHKMIPAITLRWRHNGRDSVSNHQPHDCLLNRLFRRRSKKTSKLRVTGLCAGNSPGTGEFPAQMVSNAENVSIWWRHHELGDDTLTCWIADNSIPSQNVTLRLDINNYIYVEDRTKVRGWDFQKSLMIF